MPVKVFNVLLVHFTFTRRVDANCKRPNCNHRDRTDAARIAIVQLLNSSDTSAGHFFESFVLESCDGSYVLLSVTGNWRCIVTNNWMFLVESFDVSFNVNLPFFFFKYISINIYFYTRLFFVIILETFFNYLYNDLDLLYRNKVNLIYFRIINKNIFINI